MRLSAIFVAVASLLVMSGCAVRAAAPGVKIEAGVPGPAPVKHCPPGQAKKGNC